MTDKKMLKKIDFYRDVIDDIQRKLDDVMESYDTLERIATHISAPSRYGFKYDDVPDTIIEIIELAKIGNSNIEFLRDDTNERLDKELIYLKKVLSK